MRVKIGNVAIPDATIKRFIDMESGLPLSMIRVTYFDDRISDEQIIEAFNKQAVLPFESEALKTFVLVRGFAENEKEKKHEYTLQERAADVSCGYKSVDWTQPTQNQKMVFILPDDVKDLISPYELSLLPYKRLIFRKDIPEDWFKKP